MENLYFYLPTHNSSHSVILDEIPVHVLKGRLHRNVLFYFIPFGFLCVLFFPKVKNELSQTSKSRVNIEGLDFYADNQNSEWC